MAGRITMWGANQLLNTYFTRRIAPPDKFYLALISDIPPTPYMSADELTEPANEEYARAEIDNTTYCWGDDSQPQEIYNCEQIEFPTAVSDWGAIRYWALCNAAVGGWCFLIGELEDPIQIMTGDQAIFAVGDLSLDVGPFFLAEEE